MKVWIVSECLPGLIEAWEKHGYDAVVSNKKLENYSYRNALEAMDIMRRMENIDIVFSYDFIPQISDACEIYKLEYISWITDSDHTRFLTKSLFNSVNRIFTFDYVQYNKLRLLGIKSVYHLPLHINSYNYTNIIDRKYCKEQRSYLNDVSFVENYHDMLSYDLSDQQKRLPDFLKGYIDAVINAQRCIWGDNIVKKLLNDTVISEIRDYVKLQISEDSIDGYYETFFQGIVHGKVSQLEKDELCEGLLKKYKFVKFTRGEVSDDFSINSEIIVDRFKVPLIISDSKINVNITSHSVESGIPLHVMEILACGGFCLTNYQAEIAEYFEDGKDLVIYTDFDDMYDKIDYYLEHENERIEIAFSGQNKVRKLFDLDDGIGKILQITGEG